MPSPAVFRRFADQLIERLGAIESDTTEVVRRASITYVNDDHSGFVMITTAPYGWAEITPAARPFQHRALRDYPRWQRSFRVLLRAAPSDVEKRVQRANEVIETYADHVGRHSTIPKTVATALKRLAESFDALRTVIHERCGPEALGTVVLPDTNALTDQPDVSTYGERLGVAQYRVLLAPTVLGELDKLKVDARSPEYRDKVKAVIRRIKGWRTQGDLERGVLVARGVTVAALAFEPDVAGVHASLDPQNADDRLLASALEVQAEDPGLAVVLMTSDVNLQNKAAAVGLPFVETHGVDGG